MKKQKEDENDIKKGVISNLDSHEDLFGMLKQIKFLVLSPLLAIAVWLVLRQGGVTSVLTLSAVSFVIGLVTDEAVSSLIRFVSRVLGESTSGSPSRQAAPNREEEKPNPPGNDEGEEAGNDEGEEAQPPANDRQEKLQNKK